MYTFPCCSFGGMLKCISQSHWFSSCRKIREDFPAGKPFEQGISDSHSTFEFSDYHFDLFFPTVFESLLTLLHLAKNRVHSKGGMQEQASYKGSWKGFSKELGRGSSWVSV